MPRVALCLTGLFALTAAAWFAASFVDAPPDSTCGALIYPSMWLKGYPPAGCRAVMAIRAIVAAASATAGVALVGIGAKSRPLMARKAVSAALMITGGGAALMLLINEAVRSDGAL